MSESKKAATDEFVETLTMLIAEHDADQQRSRAQKEKEFRERYAGQSAEREPQGEGTGRMSVSKPPSGFVRKGKPDA
jgi:hypothetical protein